MRRLDASYSIVVGAGQLVADAVHRQQVARLAAGLDLAAQVRDVDVDGAIVAVVVGAERARDQLVAREHASRMARERFEQPELGRRQRHGLAGDTDLPRPDVDLEIADGDGVRLASAWLRGAAVRRSSACTRATTSRGLNGLGT